MKTRKSVIAVTVGICLFWIISAAYAENWVVVYETEDYDVIAVDVDSIRKGDYGLVYYTAGDTSGGDFDVAVDCQKRIIYFINVYDYYDSNWISNGYEIVPGTNGAIETDFVCSRAR